MTRPIRFIRWAEVKRKTGISRSTIWRYEKAGLFPPRRRLGKTLSVAWIEHEVEDWIAASKKVDDGNLYTQCLESFEPTESERPMVAKLKPKFRRVVVCNQCACDWKKNHWCKIGPSEWARPTVIVEPVD